MVVFLRETDQFMDQPTNWRKAIEFATAKKSRNSIAINSLPL